MTEFLGTQLWRRTLARGSENDRTEKARERLRSAFLSFRDNAALLAGEIGGDLRQFTVHDVTHLDALWEMAALVGGDDYQLTPTEAFVLGGAFLIHDLGLAVAAYVDGVGEIRSHSLWQDTLHMLLAKELGRTPSPREIEKASAEILLEATEQTLRALHAQQAERLATVFWNTGSDRHYLIQDEQIRTQLGPLIGRIAHSHWWAPTRLSAEFDAKIGAPSWCPIEWSLDPLKLACLLRTADAAHLDERRAPRLLRALRRPGRESDKHWAFQGKLNKPYRIDDRLLYSSSQGFSAEDAGAWWLCFDALQSVDRELRAVDAVLVHSVRQRFAARRVVGTEDPRLLATHVPTPGWLPVDARLRISSIAAIISRLGGAELYGDDSSVPLRELLQNSVDAVRARRIIERRAPDWGLVTVRLGRDEDENAWVEIEDNGVGMSMEVITQALLDFGASFWRSSLMTRVLPGLASSGFEATGRYGIGFFSVFMWGHRVTVYTRRFDAAQMDTLVLEFHHGTDEPPLLRQAKANEVLVDGGTRVKVWLGKEVGADTGAWAISGELAMRSLVDLCRWLIPLADVDVASQELSGSQEVGVRALDWVHCRPESLVAKLLLLANRWRTEQTGELQRRSEAVAGILRVMTNEAGQVVARACVVPARYLRISPSPANYSDAIVTTGGLRAGSIAGLFGCFVGRPTRAARDVALPVVPVPALREWATGQAQLVSQLTDDPAELMDCANTIHRLGGTTCELPIAYSQKGWHSVEDILQWRDLPDVVLLIDDASLREIQENFDVVLAPGVLAVPKISKSLLSANYSTMVYDRSLLEANSWPSPGQLALPNGVTTRGLSGLVVQCIAEVWGVDPDAVLRASSFADEYGTYRTSVGRKDRFQLVMEVDVIRHPIRGSNTGIELLRLPRMELRASELTTLADE